jgi:hypothetical protein
MARAAIWLGRLGTGVAVVAGILLVGVWRGATEAKSPAKRSTSSSVGQQLNTIGKVRKFESGKQIILAFIGSSTCGAAARPELIPAFKEIRAQVEASAKERKAQIFVIGIATDWYISTGLRFLGEYGPFDEVIVGQNWFNTGAVKYIWRDVPGPGGTPQIVVVERDVQVDGGNVTVSDETLLARKLGLDEIIQWSRQRIRL